MPRQLAEAHEHQARPRSSRRARRSAPRSTWRARCGSGTCGARSAGRRGRRRCRSSTPPNTSRRIQPFGAERPASGAPAGTAGARGRAGGRTRAGRRRARRTPSRSRPTSPSRGSGRENAPTAARTTPIATSSRPLPSSGLGTPRRGRASARARSRTAAKRRIAGGLEERGTPRRAANTATTTAAAMATPPRHEDDEEDRDEDDGGERALAHPPALPAEPAVAPGELEQRRVERVGPEVGPERLAEHELGVGGLPDEEVATAARRRSGSEVGVGQAGRVERVADRRLVDRPRAATPSADEPPDRVDELRPAGVVQGDVEVQPLAAARSRRAPPRWTRGSRRAARRAGRAAGPARPGPRARRSRCGWPPRGGRTARRPRRPSGPSSRG